MRSLFVLLVTVVALSLPATASPHATRYCARPSAAKIASLPRQYPSFYHALRAHFKAHWVEAAIVSYGEGTWHSWAHNGQYLGTFQMGSHERATYGHSSSLAGQAAAAARYYWSDKSWSHWDCQPW